MVELGEGRPGDAHDTADRLRRARFRIEARLKVARIYFKRHEAVVAREMREEELMILAENAEQDDDEAATPELAKPTAPRQPNRKARRAAKARGKHAPPLRLAPAAT